MGKAERELARRQRQLKAQADAVAQLEAQRALEQGLAEATRIEALVPRALAALEAAGWPDGRMIHLYKTLGKDKAGWEVGYHKTYMHGEPGTRPVYLLSNGKFGAFGDPARTARELMSAPNRPVGVEQGLQQLIARYSNFGA